MSKKGKGSNAVSDYVKPVKAEAEPDVPTDVAKAVQASGVPLALHPEWSREAIETMNWGSEEDVYADGSVLKAVEGTLWRRAMDTIPTAVRMPPPPEPVKKPVLAAAASTAPATDAATEDAAGSGAGAGAPEEAQEEEEKEPPTPLDIEVVLLPPWVDAPTAEPEPVKGKKSAGKDKKGKGGDAPSPTGPSVPRELLRPIGAASEEAWVVVGGEESTSEVEDSKGDDGEEVVAGEGEAEDSKDAEEESKPTGPLVTPGAAVDVFASVVTAIAGCGANFGDGEFLWEAIYPKGPDGRPRLNPGGKYAVKLHWAGAWRQVVVDDRLPVNINGLPLFPIVTDAPRELWPAILYKAWQSLAADVPGAATDSSLLIHTLTGWIPQQCPAPLSSDRWPLLANLAPVNAISPGESYRAYLIACETARVRETRRQKLLAKHKAEEEAAEAAAAAAEAAEGKGKKGKAPAKKAPAKGGKGGKGGKAEADDTPHDPVKDVALPEWPVLPPSSAVVILTAVAGAKLPDGRPLTASAPYAVLATRRNDGDSESSVLLRGVVPPHPPKKRPRRRTSVEGPVKVIKPVITAPVDAFLPVDPAENEIWVPQSSLPSMFASTAVVCHNPTLAAGVKTTHLHWLQPGESEADLSAGAGEPPPVDTKASKGKGGKGKGKAAAAVPEPEPDTDSLRERQIAPLPQHLILKSVDARGGGVVVCVVRDVAETPREPSEPVSTDSEEAAIEGKEAKEEEGEEEESSPELPVEVPVARPVDAYAVVTVVEDHSYDYFLPLDAPPPEGDEEAAVAATDDASAADDETKASAEDDDISSHPSLFSSIGLPSSERVVLRVGTDHLQGVEGDSSLLACAALHVPAGNHLYSVDIRAPLGCSVKLLLPPTLSLLPTEELLMPEGEAAPEGAVAEDESAEGKAEEEPPMVEEIAPGIPVRISPEPVIRPNVTPFPRPRQPEPCPAFDVNFMAQLLKLYCGAAVTETSGTAPACAGDEWRVWFRHTFRLPLPEGEPEDGKVPASRVWAQLTLPNAVIAANLRLYTVNNDTGDVAAHALLTTGEQVLIPAETGYTLLATARRLSEPLPASSWRLTVLADCPFAAPLTPTTTAFEVPSTSPDPATQSFSGLYAPNKYYRFFRYMVQLNQPTVVCSARLEASDPNVWVRLEVLNAHTGETLARTAGRGAATFIALPAPPPPPEGAGAPAPAPAPAKGGKGDKPTPAEEALNAYKAALIAINTGVLGAADLVLQGSVESERWEPYKYLNSTQPFYDPDPYEAAQGDGEGAQAVSLSADMITWRLTACMGVGGFSMWRDTRWQDSAAALKTKWEAAEAGRAAQAASIREHYTSTAAPSAEELSAARDSVAVPLPRAVWDSKVDADSEESKTAREETRVARRARARLLAGDQSVVYSDLGALKAAGKNVQVYHGVVEHAGQDERSVLTDEGIEEALAQAAAAANQPVAEDEEAPPTPPSVEELYVLKMASARERESASRLALLQEQSAALKAARKAALSERELLADKRHEFRTSQVAEREQAYEKTKAEEAAKLAAAEAAAES